MRHGWFSGVPEEVGANYYHGSSLAFPDRADRRRLVNLRCFFGLLARFPALVPAARPLLSLPENAIFRLFGDVADGILLSRCLPYRPTVPQFVRLALAYLRFYR